ncbi:SNF2 family domain-containing protein [Xylariales sp. AK1849]|nr:SNF2 family domain-containing protein [Xylariales sp. AK1849]
MPGRSLRQKDGQTAHHDRSDLHQPFPRPLIDLLRAMGKPDSDLTAEDNEEPPKKRVRLDESPGYVVIARQSLTLQRRFQSREEPALAFESRNIGGFLRLQYSDGLNRCLTIKTKSPFGSHTFELFLGRFNLSKGLVAILAVAGQTRHSELTDGGMHVMVDVSFGRQGDTDSLQLRFELRWNVSANIFNSFRVGARRKLSDQVQELVLGSQKAVVSDISNGLSPQAFYEAAFIPDTRYTGPLPLSIPNLTAKLFPFQHRALQWLLGREGVCWNPNNSSGSSGLGAYPAEESTLLPLSFSEAKDVDGQQFYHSDLFHVVTRDLGSFRDLESSLKGGILAEEMGLGKTVETIALIALHRRPPQAAMLFDDFTGQHVRPTGSTLIVTPETLRKQWVSEIAKHAPKLRLMVYNGRKTYNGTEEDLVEELAEHDIVITTYNVLQAEIHFAQPPPNRSMRHERRHPRPSSPLVRLSWWRVCLDEAQQIESGVSAAAKVARLIPRVNAWGITGTPVKESIKDLWGLLYFLRYEPFASYQAIWVSLTSTHKPLFKSLFNRIALRHTKESVRHELLLPPQKRYVITMPFTAIEEQNYHSRFQALAQSCGLDRQGAPFFNDWDPDDQENVTLMKRALAQLRQTVLHPELGPGRGRVLARKDKPLRTIEEVLDAMIEETESIIKTHQRSILASKLKRGQLLENSPRVREALAIWEDVLNETEGIVVECRQQLSVEIDNARESEEAETASKAKKDSDVEDDSNEENVPPRVGEARRKLRSALDLKHRAVFFVASAWYQIKSDEEMTVPDSDEFRRLEKLEVNGYEAAKVVRKEILQEAHVKASSYMTRLQKKAASQSFVNVPEFKSIPNKGLESRRVLENLEQLGAILDDQANLIDEWRECVIQLLLRPLVDQEGEAEITGDEYEDSTKIQDDLMVYTHVLRAAVADRQDALSGLVNERVRHETKFAKRLADQGEGPNPERLLALLELRQGNKPTELQGSLRAVVADLRELATKLRHDVSNGSNRARVELEIVQEQLKLTQDQIAEQGKAATTVEKELDQFTAAMNARVEYYRQLQAVSDTVAPWEREEEEDGDDETLMQGLLAEENKVQKKLATAIATQRYQVHLKQQGQSSAAERLCPICKETYTIGCLTECTHEFCKECITLWVKAHKTCPLCKKILSSRSLQDIVVKKPELKLHSEQQPVSSGDPNSPHKSRRSGIYSDFSQAKLKEINDVELDGPSFATKVDTMIRHLMWLRQADPGAKSIIFSQFGSFLDILQRAFALYNIGFTSFDTKNGITRFKEDPAIECFLMDARSHASGLNLVNANHVFLCEPLLNTALELQAIARVDRIGQEHETTVWLYLVEGTVEESIYDLSVQRRMEHMSKNTKGKSKESLNEISDHNLEVANSLELQHAALPKLMDKDQQLGEVIDKNDLWACLFGHVAREEESARNVEESDPRFENPAVMGFLAGRAARERQDAMDQVQDEQEILALVREMENREDSSEAEDLEEAVDRLEVEDSEAEDAEA